MTRRPKKVDQRAKTEPTTKRKLKKKVAAKSKATADAANANGEHDRAFPVVGIGASAGGLEAMTQFLKGLPAGTGMSLVLVQHLDPTQRERADLDPGALDCISP